MMSHDSSNAKEASQTLISEHNLYSEGAKSDNAVVAGTSAVRSLQQERKSAWGRKVVQRSDQSANITATVVNIDESISTISSDSKDRSDSHQGQDKDPFAFNFASDLVYTRPKRRFSSQAARSQAADTERGQKKSTFTSRSAAARRSAAAAAAAAVTAAPAPAAPAETTSVTQDIPVSPTCPLDVHSPPSPPLIPTFTSRSAAARRSSATAAVAAVAAATAATAPAESGAQDLPISPVRRLDVRLLPSPSLRPAAATLTLDNETPLAAAAGPKSVPRATTAAADTAAVVVPPDNPAAVAASANFAPPAAARAPLARARTLPPPPPPPPGELRTALAALRAADAVPAAAAAGGGAIANPLPHDASVEEALRR
jgi:hypothetical protein